MVTVDMHGVRYLTSKQPPHTASKHLFEERPEEAIELADHTIAWLAENGQSTVTATPLGPAIAAFPAPALAHGEQIRALYASMHAFFVIGDRGSLRRSSDGGRTWDAVPLGLPPYARFIAIGDKDKLGGADEETYETNQRKGDGFLALWYHPMWYLESTDDGQTWHRERPTQWVGPPEKRFLSLPDVSVGQEDDGAHGANPNLGTFVAGNSLLRGQLVPGKGIDIEIGPIGGPPVHAFLALPECKSAEVSAVAGHGDSMSIAIWVETATNSRRIVYHREDRDAPFLLLPSVPAVEALELRSLFAGHGITLLLGSEVMRSSRQIWVWLENQPPRRIEAPEHDLWLFDPAGRNLWGVGYDGDLWHGHLDFAAGVLKVDPVPGWLGPLYHANHDGRLNTGKVRMSAFSVASDGTFNCTVQVEPDNLPHLVRVRADGTRLPILKLPFAQHNVNIDQRAVGFWDNRGYSSAGWETADGGEHWTRVDAWPLARNVQCIESGCLVDQGRRVGWALPSGWRQGEPAVPLAKPQSSPSEPDGKMLFECEISTEGQSLAAPFRADLWKACVPASVELARWGFVTTNEGGDTTLTVGLASGESRQLALLKSKEAFAPWMTTVGCDEHGAFAIRDPHQKLRETEKAERLPQQEPCATITYYRWNDGVTRHIELSCKESQPWNASTGLASVAVTDKGLLLANHHLERENERPRPQPWILLSDDGKRSLIPETPTSQIVASALQDGRDLWVFSWPKYGVRGDFGSVVSRFDGTSWKEEYLALSHLGLLQRIEGRPALTTFDLSGTVMAGEQPAPGETAALTPLGYFQLPIKGGELPMLKTWPSLPQAELRSCGIEAQDRPFSWWRPGLPAKIGVRWKGGGEVRETTAARLRFLPDGSSCTEVIMAGPGPISLAQSPNPFDSGGVLIFPRDPEHSWIVINALSQFAYAPAHCKLLHQ
jgi:hypothetical protein